MMNNKTWALTKVLIKNGEGLSFKLNTKKAWILFIAIIGITIPSLLFGYIKFIELIYHSLATVNQQGVILSWGLAINSIMIFIFGMFYIISSFYFSGDIENFLPLPIKPKQIVGAKFLVTVLYEYLISAFIFLPILIYYGIYESAGLLYYIYGLIVFALIPILPIAFGALIVMLIMRFTNFSRYRELFKIIGGVIAMFVGIGLNFAFQSFAAKLDQNTIGELLELGNNSLSVVTSRMFPTVRWAAQALLDYKIANGLTNLLIFCGLSAGIYIVLLYFSELVYFKGVVGLSESSARSVVLDEDLGKLLKKNSVIKSYTLNELRILFRTPIYFLNCVLINIIWPLFIILPLLITPDDPTQGDLSMLLELLREPKAIGMIIGITLAAITFIGGSNGITATAISREGKELHIKKHIPVSYRHQITAKVLAGIVLSYIGVVILILIMIFLYKLPWYLGLLLLVIGILPTILTSFTGILLDLYNPKLDWDSEQKAVKQNMNVLYNILISTAAAALIGVITYVFKSSAVLTIISIIVLISLLDLLLYYLVYTKGTVRFKELEG